MSRNLGNSKKTCPKSGILGDEMKTRIQIVMMSTVVAAMLSFPSVVSMAQFSLVKAGPGPVCPGIDPCALSTDAPKAGPGPVCPVGVECIR
jgi:hypothetical protein